MNASRAALARGARRELARRELARRHLIDFVTRTHDGYRAGWVHHLICKRLERFAQAVADGKSPRLILTMPPRHGKTAIVSQRFPVWAMGRYQTIDGAPLEVAVASYAQELADDNSRAARMVARSPEALSVFPHLAPRVDAKQYKGDYKRADVDKITIWKAGVASYKAVGIGGPLTGRGAHILIIDDYVKDRAEADSKTYRDAAWSWYRSTAYTRVAPGGGVIVMATRWHEDDLIGRLLAEQANGDGDAWEVLNLPAIDETDTVEDGVVLRRAGEPLHPDRWPLPALEQRKRAIGFREWSALFLCRPTASGGGIFERGWFVHRHRFTPALARTMAWEQLVISADLTFDDGDASDDVAIHVWGRLRGRFYLLDRWAQRASYTVARQAFKGICAAWPHALTRLVEKAANGAAMVDDLQHEYRCIPVKVAGGPSKRERARAVSPLHESGAVVYPDDTIADWMHEWVERHVSFTGASGGKDDDVDAESQALAHMTLGEQPATAEDQAAAADAMLSW